MNFRDPTRPAGFPLAQSQAPVHFDVHVSVMPQGEVYAEVLGVDETEASLRMVADALAKASAQAEARIAIYDQVANHPAKIEMQYVELPPDR